MRYVRTCTGLGLAALFALLLTGCSREGADWKAATLTNTTEAYQVFLQQHPHAAHAADAQARLQQLLEQRDWQLASAADTRDAYQQFVTQHPDSKWVQEARLRIENFAQAGVSGGNALPTAGTAATGVVATGDAAEHPAPAPTTAADANAGGRAPEGKARSATAAHATTARAGTAHTTTTARAATAGHAGRGHAPSSRALVTSSAARRAAAAHSVHRHSPALLARRRDGSRLVQLGAFRSKARAESEWRLLTARFSTLRRLQPHYVAARSRNGRVIRLQVRMSSSAAANGLCATLRKYARACVRVNA